MRDLRFRILFDRTNALHTVTPRRLRDRDTVSVPSLGPPLSLGLGMRCRGDWAHTA